MAIRHTGRIHHSGVAMRRSWLASMFFFPLLLHAQRASDLREGARLQVTPVQGHIVTGEFVGVVNDSLQLLIGRKPIRRETIPVTQIRDARISAGRSRGRGAAIGALIGAVIGAGSGVALGIAVHDDAYTKGQNAAMAGTVLGAGGAIIGAIAGAIHGTENWKPVRIPRS
jgi:hypothetical protein